mmetsp:Transcript_16510/g.24854  ORF Transcript_16510/g.24854 Transcript_16510/m.24854 type:complete len:393 (-) Transcript_16510:146-1324(-)
MSKKKGQEEEKVLFGRPKNNVTIGLVGLPNVGKSSTFNLLGKLQVPAENYPFCTIDPAVTSVPVPDERFNHLVEAFKPKKEIQAVLAVTDIAGLVKGAAEGKGLGNAFLSNIAAVDAIFHVVRKFPGKKIEHVEGSIDPTRDLAIIRAELQKKDLERLKLALETETKKLRGGKKPDKKQELEIGALKKAITCLESGQDVRFLDWNSKEVYFLNTFNLLSAKPVVYLVNMSMKAYKEGKSAGKKITKWVEENTPGEPIIHYSVKYENGLLKLSEEKRAKLKKKGVGSAIPNIIWAGYKALRLHHFFTVGKDEVRAWSVRMKSKAPQAAGVIHGDFEKHFQSAEVYNFDDFKKYGTEAAVKAAGKLMTKGKEYVVQNGDIMFIKHSAGGAGKKK